MVLADTLSRAALTVSEDDGCNEFDTIPVNAIDFIPMRKECTDQVRDATQTDTVLLNLISTIQKGWPGRNFIPSGIGVFYHIRDELAITNGLIYRGDRLVILKEMRNTIMKDIHLGHSGIDGCLRLRVLAGHVSGDQTNRTKL